jgi:hypothetical protein
VKAARLLSRLAWQQEGTPYLSFLDQSDVANMLEQLPPKEAAHMLEVGGIFSSVYVIENARNPMSWLQRACKLHGESEGTPDIKHPRYNKASRV